MTALEISFLGPSAESWFALVAVSAFAAVVLRRLDGARAALTLLLLVALVVLRGDVAFLAVWLALGLVERREDGAVPVAGRLGDLAVLLLLVGLPPGAWRAIAVVVAVCARAGAWPFRAPDPVSAVAIATAALVALAVAGWHAPGLPIAGIALATAIAAAVRADPDRALVRAAAAHAVVSALVVARFPEVAAVHAIGFALLVCGRMRTGWPARASVLLGAACLIGLPPLPGFVTIALALLEIRDGPPGVVIAFLATHVLLGATVVRVSLARLDGGRGFLMPGAGGLVVLALLLGILGLAGGALGGPREVVVVLAAAGTSIGLGILLSTERALAVLRAPERVADRLATFREALRRGARATLDPDRAARMGPITRPAADVLAAAVAAAGRRPIASLLVALTLALALLLAAPRIGGILGC